MTLVRHTTPLVDKGVCYGATDLPLAPGFEREADLLLTALPPASGILTSPLSRCCRLADRIGAHLGLTVAVDENWREMDFGRWEGQRWDAIPRDALDAWAGDFLHYRDHGGESVQDLQDRVARGLDTAPDGAVIVTHMGCIKAALYLRGDPKGWDAKHGFGAVLPLP